MANGNNFWKKLGISFSIVVTIVGASIGYGQLLSQTKENKEDIKEIVKKIDKVVDKLEIKMDKIGTEQIELKIQNAEILGLVKYLKEKSND